MTPLRWRLSLLAALLVVPLVTVLALSFGHDPHAVPFVLQGKPAANFALRDVNGSSVKLTDFRGTPVVLNFWATWCYPCQAEHTLLQQAARIYGQRVQFLGIIYQDSEDAVRRYLQGRPSIFPQLHDENSTTSIDYGVAGVPESYIIDPHGRIVFKQAGVLTVEILRRHLDPLISAKVPGVPS